MRKTTIRQALTEAADTLGMTPVTISHITVRKGTRSNGGAVKLVDATITDADNVSVRLTSVPTQLLRGTSGAQTRLVDLIAAADANEATAGDAETIADHRAGEATGPVCGADTSTGDPCQRPSADGSACWQHGGDSARRGLVAKADGTPVATHKPTDTTPRQPKASGPVDWVAVAKVAAEAAAKAAVEAAIAAHATA